MSTPTLTASTFRRGRAPSPAFHGAGGLRLVCGLAAREPSRRDNPVCLHGVPLPVRLTGR